MKVFLDTNIVLDVVLERKPFYSSALELFQAVQTHPINFYISATSITDLYYIIRKAKGRDVALEFLKDLLSFVTIASVDAATIQAALRSPLHDFEDAVQVEAAKQATALVIVTRNPTDFIQADLQIFSPTSFLATL